MDAKQPPKTPRQTKLKILFDEAIIVIDDKFGMDYAKRNPVLLSAVLKLQATI